ncbi:hypothetical protein GQ44DRAFT_773623 [Phaeosphaeriaceae sp. PMI808]|nr:hypothetical protein GQ44DRAFT_773623 [Phaeosphaeriaceae sp. PMI808]
MAAANSRETIPQDSFSDLTGLMKAKRPYNLNLSPTHLPLLTPMSNDASKVRIVPSGNATRSPKARPFASPAISVTSFLQKQEIASLGTTRHGHGTISDPLIEFEESAGDSSEVQKRTYPCPLRPDFLSPPQVGLFDNQKPAEHDQLASVYGHPELSSYNQMPIQEFCFEEAKSDAMDNASNVLFEEKRSLEKQVVSLKNKHPANPGGNEAHTQLDGPRYYNKAKLDQMAATARNLTIKDGEHGPQQFDVETLEHELAITEIWMKQNNSIACTKSLETQTAAIRTLVETVKRLTLERNNALFNAEKYVFQAQNAANERINHLRQTTLEEQMRANELEEELKQFREKVNQKCFSDLNESLQEKKVQCSRFRIQLKQTEQQLKLMQDRLNTATSHGEYLRGGAHPVAPSLQSKLPNKVVACFECYVNNLPCDNKARCQSCVTHDAKCTRWRCSLKQKLGECHGASCLLAHDSQGWLVLKRARPEW